MQKPIQSTVRNTSVKFELSQLSAPKGLSIEFKALKAHLTNHNHYQFRLKINDMSKAGADDQINTVSGRWKKE